MKKQQKILTLDDDADWLDVCREILLQLPSKPEIRTVSSSRRALAMLDAEPFRLLICDLKMPRIDGLQVLAIVRKRFPELRTIVLSGLDDDEFRSRAYALGVDLFWLKSDMQRDTQLFLECIESLLGRDVEEGFRGIQSKSLMDIIQMECLTRSSTVLRITRGPLVAKIWIQDGELLDAEVEGLRGEAAIQRILAWQSGSFENLPAEPSRERTIHKSVNALLLESAQTIDESADVENASETANYRKNTWKLAQLAREGADFIISVPSEPQSEPEILGLDKESATPLVEWSRLATKITTQLGQRLGSGPLSYVTGLNLERHLFVLPREQKSFLVGWPAEAEGMLFETSKKLVASWES